MALLVGDVGGTKTRLGICTARDGPRRPTHEETYASGDYKNLEEIIDEFVPRTGIRLTAASFGVAGPVVNGRVSLTNLPWVVDAAQIRQALGIDNVHLLNDVAAAAYAVPLLNPNEIDTLKAGDPEHLGAIAVIAPGTGLGEAFLVWDGSRYQAHPSEGGHADFAPVGSLQRDLLCTLEDRYDRVSYERVCSGMAVPDLYRFLKECGYGDEPRWLTTELESAADETPVIIQAGLANRSELCVKTLELFVAILGAEAGNLALKVMATGGLYLAGGIPPRIRSALKEPHFMNPLHAKGRHRSITERIPVHVMLAPKAPLWGAARYGLDVNAEL